MASILKVDKIRGTGLDSDTISLDGSGNITIPKNVTFSGTSTFSGTVSGDNGGAWEVIASDTTGGSGTNIEFDLSINAKYFTQKLIVHGVYRTDGSDGDLYGRARNDADNSFFTSGYYTSIVHYDAQLSGSRTNSNAGDWNAAHFRIGGYNIGDHAEHEDSVWEFDFYNTIGTTKRMVMIGRRCGHSSDATFAVENFAGRLLHTAQVDRFQLTNGSGATTGYAGYQLYGLLKT